jgi:hypothetical protein
MALNNGFNISVGNMQNCKGIQEEVGKVNGINIYISNDETSPLN